MTNDTKYHMITLP